MSLFRLFPRLAWSGFMVLVILAISCGRKTSSVIPEELAKRCVVIVDNGAAAPPVSWAAWLNRYMPNVPRFDSRQMDEAIRLCLEKDLALIVTDGFTRAENQPSLQDYVARGARLVVLGRGEFLSEAERESMRDSSGYSYPPYSVTSRLFRVSSTGEDISLPDLRVSSPSPPAFGHGGASAVETRWTPVVEALGPNGASVGWAASYSIIPQGANYGFSICGWLGIEPVRENMKELAPLVNALLTEVTRDAYLYKFGMQIHSAESQTPVKTSARIIDRRLHDTRPLRLVARWVNASGIEVRRHVSPPLDIPFMPTELALGPAPEPGGDSAADYTVELLVRDRNDQVTIDSASQTIKVFPRNYRTREDAITVSGHQFMQGPKPVFMLGVNYWPRIAAPRAGSSANGHWLNPEWFHPHIVRSDLDLLAAANINTIAIEYTDIAQAPQLAFVLDELRARNMWASVYMPSLHPMDLRMDEALKMLEAIKLPRWPELFAIEIARGLIVRSRADNRRFDEEWADWLEESFGSISAAEQKMGVTLWRERGKPAGPPDAQLQAGPHRDRAIALYFAFLDNFVSRHTGYIKRTLRERGYNTLLTARSAYGWPDEPPPAFMDALDISAGAMHLDFMSPDAWTIHPLQQTHPDGPAMSAYIRGVSGGKPVVWSAFGHDVGVASSAESLQRQDEVYRHFMNVFIDEGSSGAYAWWYPAGSPQSADRDYGIMTPQGRWRPVEDAIRATRSRLRQTRIAPPKGLRYNAPLNQSARQWSDAQANREGIFADVDRGGIITEWTLPGTGLDTALLLSQNSQDHWSVIDGFYVLNAEWGTVRSSDARQERPPGARVNSYAGRTLQMEIINSGTARWRTANAQTTGSVWIRISQPGKPPEWLAVGQMDQGGQNVIAWTPREPGLWELQPFLIGYGKFGERLRLEITTPPGLF